METEQVYKDTYSIEELADDLEWNVKWVEFYIAKGIIKFECTVSSNGKSVKERNRIEKLLPILEIYAANEFNKLLNFRSIEGKKLPKVRSVEGKKLVTFRSVKGSELGKRWLIEGNNFEKLTDAERKVQREIYSTKWDHNTLFERYFKNNGLKIDDIRLIITGAEVKRFKENEYLTLKKTSEKKVNGSEDGHGVALISSTQVVVVDDPTATNVQTETEKTEGDTKDVKPVTVKKQGKQTKKPPSMLGYQGPVKKMILGGLESYYKLYGYSKEISKLPEQEIDFRGFIVHLHTEFNKKTRPSYFGSIKKISIPHHKDDDCITKKGKSKPMKQKDVYKRFKDFEKLFTSTFTPSPPDPDPNPPASSMEGQS